MKQILTALTVLLLVGCNTPTAPEMPTVQPSADLGPMTSDHHFPPGDPHEWMGSYSGSWLHQLGPDSVALTVLNVNERRTPIQISGKVTISGVTFRIAGKLISDLNSDSNSPPSSNYNPKRWVWENVATTAGCPAGNMTGEFVMVDNVTISGFSSLVVVDGCMGLTPPTPEPTVEGNGNGNGNGNSNGSGSANTNTTEEYSLDGPCTLNRTSI